MVELLSYVEPEVLAKLLESLVLFLTSILLGAATTWVRRRYTAEQLRAAANVARIAVDAVEQVYRRTTGTSPDEKFAEALNRARVLGERYGIRLTDAQWEAIIESEVRQMNKWRDVLLQQSQEP